MEFELDLPFRRFSITACLAASSRLAEIYFNGRVMIAWRAFDFILFMLFFLTQLTNFDVKLVGIRILTACADEFMGILQSCDKPYQLVI